MRTGEGGGDAWKKQINSSPEGVILAALDCARPRCITCNGRNNAVGEGADSLSFGLAGFWNEGHSSWE